MAKGLNLKNIKLPGDDELADTAGALFGRLEQIPVDLIDRNPDQPRTAFSDEEIAELADSIREHDLAQPICVRPPLAGRYTLIAGERRLRAFKLLGRPTIPTFVTSARDPEVLALLENIQRVDLTPIELSAALAKLRKRHARLEDLARATGKSISYLSRTLAIQDLPGSILAEFAEHRGKLSQAKLDELVSVKDADLQRAMWEAVKNGDSSLALRAMKRAAPKAGASEAGAPADLVARTMKRVDAMTRDVSTLRGNATALDAGQRAKLKQLHDEVTAMLRELGELG